MNNTLNPNHLINEQSPYLLQHAYNPVDWYPWCNEAFEKAELEDKPVFLSIGYSTCHWCHVMERESFEDIKVAEILNKYFVSIKVDREERGDIDSIYMMVCQLMNGSGGWPLTIFLTPDKKPFFAGTYFPKENRFGRIGFIELINSIQNAWINNKNEIISSANELSNSLQQIYSYKSHSVIEENILDKTFEYFDKRFDNEFGGFGSAPKFPSPHNLMFLLRYWKKTENDKSLSMVTKTLQSIYSGGIYDHIGFGLHRYSTDRFWLVPHFEKMLYDQALMIIAYSEAFQVTHNNEFKKAAEEIIHYVLRDLKSDNGSFYSAEDADSEGMEGKFYLWTKEEITTVLNKKEAELFLDIYGVTAEGNFIDEVTKTKNGFNILHIEKSISQLSKLYGKSEEVICNDINSIRNKLFIHRKKRIHPFKDDKILTDWNALMIAALSIAGRIFNDEYYIQEAINSINFINKNLVTENNILLHRYRNNKADINGNLDDYAFLIWAAIELYQSTFDMKYVNQAIELTNHTLNHFWDNNSGGFFLTAVYSEKLIVRTKEIYDGAIPSGNSVMALNLIRLARITSDNKYEEYVHNLFKTFSGTVKQSPASSSFLLTAFQYLISPSHEIIISCKKYSTETANIIRELNNAFIPNKVVILKTEQNKLPFDYLDNYSTENNYPTIYVCKNYKCSLPVHSVNDVLKLLNEN